MIKFHPSSLGLIMTEPKVKTELLGVNVPVPPDQIPVVVAPAIVPESTDKILFLKPNEAIINLTGTR